MPTTSKDTPASPSPRKEPLRFRWEKAVRDSDISPLAKLCAYTLATYMDRDNASCYPGVDLLAKGTGLSKPTVIKFLQALVDHGWLHRWTLGKDREEQNQAWQRNWRRYQYTARIPTQSEKARNPWDIPAKQRQGDGETTREVVNAVNHLKPRGGKRDPVEVVNPVNPNIAVNISEKEKTGEGGRNGSETHAHDNPASPLPENGPPVADAAGTLRPDEKTVSRGEGNQRFATIPMTCPEEWKAEIQPLVEGVQGWDLEAEFRLYQLQKVIKAESGPQKTWSEFTRERIRILNLPALTTPKRACMA